MTLAPGLGPTGAPVTAAAPIARATIDAEGRLLTLNAHGEGLLGVDAAEVRGLPLDELAIPPDLRAAFWAGLLGVVSGRTPLTEPVRFRSRVQGPKGPSTSVDVTIVCHSTEPLVLTGYVNELPEEEHRRERAERLLEIGRQVASLTGWEIDLVTGKAIWTPGHLELVGVPDEDLPPDATAATRIPFVDEAERTRFLTRREDVLMHPDRHVGQLERFITRIRRPEGGTRDLLVSWEVYEDETGEPRWFTGVTQDVTAMISTEREIDALHAVCQAIREWDDENGFNDLLRVIGDGLAASMVALWVRDGAAGELWCRSFWTRSGFDAADLEEVCRRVPVRRGAGATGRAFVRGRSGHEVPSPASPYGSVARALGMEQVVGIPATCEGEVLAVLAVGFLDPRAIDDRLLASFDLMGGDIGRFLHDRRGDLVQQPLSTRELQVLRLAAEGHTGPEIAQRLRVSPATVKTHFMNLYVKLGVADRAAAVAQAFRLGLLR